MTAPRGGDALSAVYSETCGLAARADRIAPGARKVIRDRVAAVMARELAAIRAEAANTTTTTTANTTGRNTTSGPDPYARRRAPARARREHN